LVARRTATLAAACIFTIGVVAGCNGNDEPSTGTPSQRAGGNQTDRTPTEEYRVAKAIRAFVTALVDGDSETACRQLTPGQQAAVKARLRRPTCERAVRLQAISMRGADVERLSRARVSKVSLQGTEGTAEVLTPPQRAAAPEPHTVRVKRIDGEWRVASSFFPGRLRGGKVPRPPPPPPPNPVQERKIRVLFERFRSALNRGDGRTACRLQTAAAQRGAVSQSVDAAGGRRAVVRDYGGLSCAAVSAGLRVPDEKIKRITVEAGSGRLTLEHGAAYGFRMIDGRWKLDS
jgi:hypothetical protein